MDREEGAGGRGGGQMTEIQKGEEGFGKVVKMDEEHEAELQRLNHIQKQRMKEELWERSWKEGRGEAITWFLSRRGGVTQKSWEKKKFRNLFVCMSARAHRASTDSEQRCNQHRTLPRALIHCWMLIITPDDRGNKSTGLVYCKCTHTKCYRGSLLISSLQGNND